MESVKISNEESQSGLINFETFLAACLSGWLAYSKGIHPGMALLLGVVVWVILRMAVVHVGAIFWLWTLSLSLTAGYWTFVGVRKIADGLWAMLAGTLASLFVIMIHSVSREHCRIEDTPNESKILTKNGQKWHSTNY